MLALELMAEYRPLTLATDKGLASDAIHARLVPTLLKEIALNLDLRTAPDRLEQQQQSPTSTLDTGLVHDCLKWYRLCLRDEAFAASNRQVEKRMMMGENAVEIMELLETWLDSDQLPTATIFAFHSLLCQASKIEYVLRMKEDWKDLEKLGMAIDFHRNACEWQQRHLKRMIQHSKAVPPGHALAMTQLLEMQLHSAYCWVSGSATFYCVMAGAQTQQSSTGSIGPEQAMDVSDQIIERFAETTRHLHTSEPHTAFLIKYGSKRMEDLELALLNYVSAIDNLKLDGISYVPSTRQTTSHVLYTVKDIMEGQAARMKGWGGLHERAHMHLLLIRDCATSLERAGGMTTGETGSQAIAKGCLWASTARLLRSLHRLLAEWKEWNTLGQAKISLPSQPAKKSLSDASAVESADFTELENMDFLPDDLFFDWNLWMSDETEILPLC